MKLGILGHGFIGWGGGLDFLRLICGSLAAASPGSELHLLLPTRGPLLQARRVARLGKRILASVLGLNAPRAAMPGMGHILDSLQFACAALQVHHIDIGSAAIAAAARRLALDALVPAVQPLGSNVTAPWLGYIADFQHCHLPHFFSDREIAARNRDFSDMLDRAGGVIVNARSVAMDIQRFMPQARARITVLPFGAAPDPAWLELNEPPIGRYGIGERYFIISNQFWQHKDHCTAYRAFAQVLRQHPDLHLVCTGETRDFRKPEHFALLCQEAHSLGIDARLRVLGLIPKRDQIALLRSALAVVQPTLFEGGPGGGSVFDAVALGVPAIVSDVPVNLEIDEPNVSFFKASDVEALAQNMTRRAAAGPAARPDPRQLVEAGQRRRRACGHALLSAVAALRDERSSLSIGTTGRLL